MNGQRDKKGQKLTKTEGRSSEDASGLTFWSLPRQGPSRTTARSGPPHRGCACTAAQLGCGGGLAMYCVTDMRESEARRFRARLGTDTQGHRQCV